MFVISVTYIIIYLIITGVNLAIRHVVNAINSPFLFTFVSDHFIGLYLFL